MKRKGKKQESDGSSTKAAKMEMEAKLQKLQKELAAFQRKEREQFKKDKGRQKDKDSKSTKPTQKMIKEAYKRNLKDFHNRFDVEFDVSLVIMNYI